MAELVDAHGSGPCGETHGSSSLPLRTQNKKGTEKTEIKTVVL